MRIFHIRPKWFGCLLGMQLLTMPATNAQEPYAYNNRKLHTASRQQGDTNNKPDNRNDKQSLFKVLKDLNKSKGVYFLFADETLGEKLVNPVKDNNIDIEKILEQVLQKTGLKYKKVNDKTYVILADKDSKDDLNMLPNAAGETVGPSQSMAALVTGKIADGAGEPVVGASVTVKGTKRGTSTNASGIFSIEAAKGDVLMVTAVGFNNEEFTVGDDANLSISLTASNAQMTEVVVTALGISRKSKSVTYATQRISNEELTTVKDPNMVNSLSGKVAGLTINRSASGAGGSVRIVMRGNKSTQNNSPLYVIDGIPMYNSPVAQPTDLFGQSSGTASAGRDGGDAISNLNPEDIESIQVLKGASAAALYGSQAANGAILVTTKKGKSGSARINVVSSITVDDVMLKPEAQFAYGQSGAGNEDGWGTTKNGKGDYTDQFYKTGVTWINGLNLMAGGDKAQTYFSYSNTDNKGVIPTAHFNRHTLAFRETAKFFNDKLSVDGFVTLTKQRSVNRPTSGLYNNPQMGVYFFPRNLDFGTYKNAFEVRSPLRELNVQNWWNVDYDNGAYGNEYSQNPYWILNRNQRRDSRERAFSALTLKYQLLPWLSVQARGSYDFSVDDYDISMFASTHPIIADFNGRYSWERSKNGVAYGDAFLLINKDFGSDFSFNATAGAAINDARVDDRTFIDSYGAVNADGVKQGLSIANIFNVQNIQARNATKEQKVLRYQTQSILGSASIGWREMVYLDLTARNDWSSTLTFTPNKSFLYYSAGATGILNQMFHLPEVIDLAKLRVSYAKVGNATKPFVTRPPLYKLNPATGALVKELKATYPGKFLVPEDNRSFEIGTEWHLLKNRLGIDFTWYSNNNFDQYFEVVAPQSSGFNTYYYNLGQIRNTGVELMLTGVPVKNKTFEWSTNVNFATNKNTVVNLTDVGSPDISPFYLTKFDNTYASIVQQGGSFGDILSNVAARDDKGNLLLNTDGAPTRNTERKVVGNPNPDFTLGWSNQFNYKGIELNVLFDGRFGGKVMSITQAELDVRGFSEASAAARDNGGVQVKGMKNGAAFDGKVDAKAYYSAIGGRAGIGEFYMYDATAIRLRELSLGYKVPVKSGSIKSVTLALIGRNLFFVKREAPFDPEISMSTNDGLQGVDAFGLPATRSIGLSAVVSF